MSRKSDHSRTHAKRTAAKHEARRRLGWHVWGSAGGFPVAGVLAFGAVLGLAMGVGYWGAETLFGHGRGAAKPSGPVVIQQTADERGVILADPNAHGEPERPAYEEMVHEHETVHEPAPLPNAAQIAAIEHDTLDGLVERTQDPAWLANALPAESGAGDAPMVAVVIDDMGVDRARSRRMWEDVPGPLTLSFMTYAEDLPEQSRAARESGHELFLHMSMEPGNGAIDPGPNVLMSSMPDGELRTLANWGMDRFDGFVGVNNHMGSRFTEDARAMRVVLEEIQKRGLMFLDSRTSSKTVGPKVARDLGLAALERNVFLDNVNDPDEVLKQLDAAETLARKHGYAIAIGHPRDATIEVLKTWMVEARARGVHVVPISAVMRSRLQKSTQSISGYHG
ncbi:MAG: divergent polysaccharide deacetylase family protein [Alphaproteobacteria bacterium]|nr:divergent polysaccharide deacetylase family protein [Alphaproteobacteria bacterium]MBF0249451.1 divergent polysaccharide deacetylase family protein [Alphaproteobacteria bacterium]